MGKQSPTFRDFNPTGDERVALIKTNTDELIGLVRGMTVASGPEAQRRASLAITNLEQGAMWAVKALFSEDAIDTGEREHPMTAEGGDVAAGNKKMTGGADYDAGGSPTKFAPGD